VDAEDEDDSNDDEGEEAPIPPVNLQDPLSRGRLKINQLESLIKEI